MHDLGRISLDILFFFTLHWLITGKCRSVLAQPTVNVIPRHPANAQSHFCPDTLNLILYLYKSTFQRHFYTESKRINNVWDNTILEKMGWLKPITSQISYDCVPSSKLKWHYRKYVFLYLHFHYIFNTCNMCYLTNMC